MFFSVKSQVILPPGMQRRVDYYLREYISQKPRGMDVFSRSSSNGSIATDEGLFEQPEPLLYSTAAMEKIISRRSLQMRTEQQTWQVQELSNLESMICLFHY